MTKLEATIERLNEAIEECREATRESHQATKDLRHERKEAERVLAEMRSYVADAIAHKVDTAIACALEARLKSYMDEITKAQREVEAKVTEQIQQLYNLMMRGRAVGGFGFDDAIHEAVKKMEGH